jgi:hypothetical protein
LILEYFSKMCPKTRAWLKSDTSNGHFTWYTYVHLWHTLVQFYLEWEMFQAKVVQKMKKTYFKFNAFFSKIVPFMR